jgi:hypothetical protein
VATYTLTATAVPTMTPPSVRIVVGASGSGIPSQVTVQRIDADGITRPVRSPNGTVVPISGGGGLVYDSEYPYSTSATYTLKESPGTTAAFTMTVARPWLTHVGKPSLSFSFTSGRASSGSTFATESSDLQQSVLPVLGSAYPIVISGGARMAPTSVLPVLLQTAADQATLRALLADGSPLLLNAPTGYGLPTRYISVGKVDSAWLSPLVSDTYRLVNLPYQVTARPGGPAQAPVTWAMESAKYTGAWSTIPAGKTWAQLADPTTL